jgi:hypothetical protein
VRQKIDQTAKSEKRKERAIISFATTLSARYVGHTARLGTAQKGRSHKSPRIHYIALHCTSHIYTPLHSSTPLICFLSFFALLSHLVQPIPQGRVPLHGRRHPELRSFSKEKRDERQKARQDQDGQREEGAGGGGERSCSASGSVRQTNCRTIWAARSGERSGSGRELYLVPALYVIFSMKRYDGGRTEDAGCAMALPGTAPAQPSAGARQSRAEQGRTLVEGAERGVGARERGSVSVRVRVREPPCASLTRIVAGTLAHSLLPCRRYLPWPSFPGAL